MSVLWAVGIFFSPSSAVRALFFLSYLKERGTSFSLSSVRHVEKIEHFQARKRTIFFSTRKRHETRPFSLSLSCSSSLKIALSHNRYRLLDRAGDHPMRRSFALFERGRRSSSSRSTTTRESKRERKRGKKKKHSEATRETKGSKNSWVRHIFFSFMKFFEALKRKRTSRITQQPGRARVR